MPEPKDRVIYCDGKFENCSLRPYCPNGCRTKRKEIRNGSQNPEQIECITAIGATPMLWVPENSPKDETTIYTLYKELTPNLKP